MQCDQPYVSSAFTDSKLRPLNCSNKLLPGVEIMQFGFTKQAEEGNILRQPVVIFGCAEKNINLVWKDL